MATKKAAAKSSVRRGREHVEGTRKPETRRRRIEKSVALLAAGKKEPR